tara:strand:- start:805 stop:936 length:132 start_codon:yes stop_codon:yes gene_type:complete
MFQFGINFARACLQVASVISSANFWNNVSTHWEDETENWEDIG